VNVSGNDRDWRVGELAAATGLTVRTLHHYHEIGLLTPSGRTGAGHRLYTSADVRRLHQIRALRGFGLSLAEIADVLAAAVAPRELLERQLAQVVARIDAAARLRRNLVDVLGALDHRIEPSVADIVSLIEVMTTVEQKLTHQQVQEMTEQRARFAEQLDPAELTAMAARRTAMAERMSPAELAAMTARRAAMMPTEPPATP
jgi:DNA-binding transcriptional MerR regulator